jgi:hypothetical protein
MGSATPAATPAAPSAPTTRAVHPAARWVARLFSPMSLKDQEYCTDRFQRLLWGTLLVSFPIAYWIGNVLITVGAVCGATVVSLVLFVPNWYQHPDPLLKYADDTDVYNYYQQYEAAKKAARGAAAAPSATTADDGATPASRKAA